MNRSIRTLPRWGRKRPHTPGSYGALSSVLATSLSIGALAAICLSSPPAAAQYAPPPVEVIATLVPVYHEGHATYWYNGYWHYRDTHGAWAYYHEEPAFLRDYRAHHPSEYHHYGRR